MKEPGVLETARACLNMVQGMCEAGPTKSGLLEVANQGRANLVQARMPR